MSESIEELDITTDQDIEPFPIATELMKVSGLMTVSASIVTELRSLRDSDVEPSASALANHLLETYFYDYK